jgi:threonine dehydrogenase-like Zn-dependent dehydrogenase
MQVVAVTGKRTCEIVERPDPLIKGNFVKIAIRAAPLCTEVRAYREGATSDSLGHEAAGEVVEVAQPGRVAVGDRVVVMPQYGCGQCSLCLSGEHIHCQHPVDPCRFCDSPTGRATYAQFCIKQDWLLVPIPDDISYDHASMACCGLGPTFNAMQQMGVNALDTVLVSGLGAVGLGAVINARCRGARVIALESNEYRASLAKALGVEAVIDPRDEHRLERILELTAGCGADKSVETSSAETAPAFLVQATRRKGHVASVGWGGPVMAKDIVAKGLTVYGIWHWNHYRDTEAMFRTIRQSRSMLERVITHVFAMRDVNKAWELQLTGQCGKIILHPWD